MYADPDISQRINSSGEWRPPRPMHSNQISKEGDWYYHPAETGSPLQKLSVQPGNTRPDNLEHFRTLSMYYSQGSFWIVPYNATKRQVGTGYHDEGHEGRRPSGWSDEGESDVEHTTHYIDWKQLSFGHPSAFPNDNTSFATIGGHSPRLFVQHASQDQWVNWLLPDRYHSESHQTATGAGGMVGSLPILIGLKAFSVKPEDVLPTLAYGLCGGQWPPQCQRKGQGCKVPVIRTVRISGLLSFEP